MDFIQTNITQMVKNGYLEIRPDRLHFINDEAVSHFMDSACKFVEQVVDYAVDNRNIIRVLMLESLKNGKHQNSLFRFVKFMSGNDENPIFKTISSADRDFVYSDEMVLFKFFFSIIPIVSFAAYFDDYKAVSSLDDDKLRSTFLRVYQIVTRSLISGSDILLKSNNSGK